MQTMQTKQTSIIICYPKFKKEPRQSWSQAKYHPQTTTKITRQMLLQENCLGYFWTELSLPESVLYIQKRVKHLCAREIKMVCLFPKFANETLQIKRGRGTL